MEIIIISIAMELITWAEAADKIIIVCISYMNWMSILYISIYHIYIYLWKWLWSELIWGWSQMSKQLAKLLLHTHVAYQLNDYVIHNYVSYIYISYMKTIMLRMALGLITGAAAAGKLMIIYMSYIDWIMLVYISTYCIYLYMIHQ